MDEFSALLDRITPRAELVIYSALLLGAGTLLAALADGAVRRLLRRAEQHNLHVSPEVSTTIARAVRLVVFALAIIVMLNFWGLGLGGIWAGMLWLLAGIGVALIATWALVSNITGALFLAVWRPYRLGDVFEVLPEAVKGRAIDRNLMFTVLRQDDGGIVSIPNNPIFQRVVRCYPAPFDSAAYEDTPPVETRRSTGTGSPATSTRE